MFKLMKKSQALLEYMTLIVFILGALFVMQKYIVRGFSGRWKGVGDSLGQERLYDSNTTTSCVYDDQYHHIWYSERAFEDNGCAQFCYFDKELLDAAARIILEDSCKACIQRSLSAACDY